MKIFVSLILISIIAVGGVAVALDMHAAQSAGCPFFAPGAPAECDTLGIAAHTEHHTAIVDALTLALIPALLLVAAVAAFCVRRAECALRVFRRASHVIFSEIIASTRASAAILFWCALHTKRKPAYAYLPACRQASSVREFSRTQNTLL